MLSLGGGCHHPSDALLAEVWEEHGRCWSSDTLVSEQESPHGWALCLTALSIAWGGLSAVQAVCPAAAPEPPGQAGLQNAGDSHRPWCRAPATQQNTPGGFCGECSFRKGSTEAFPIPPQWQDIREDTGKDSAQARGSVCQLPEMAL